MGKFCESSACLLHGKQNLLLHSFGIVPIKDASVARKIAEEIDFVTRTYPQKLELADEFAPFREVMVNTYCNMIENGSSYWYEVVNS